MPPPGAAPAWRPTLSGVLRERALDCARSVGRRLGDPERVAAAIHGAGRRSSRFEFAGPSLACGFPSLAMALIQLTRVLPDEGWERQLHTCLSLSARSTTQSPLLAPSLYGGTGGFALVLAQAAETEPRYAPTAGRVRAAFFQHIADGPWRPETARGHRGEFNQDQAYDVVTGASGVLRAVIANGGSDPAARISVGHLIRYLIQIAEGDGARRLLSPADSPDRALLEECPDGYFDLGLAHGCAGPLAALALAWLAGHRRPGQLEAIRHLADWMVDRRVRDPWGVNWPNHVGRHTMPARGAPVDRPPSRAGWCYGALGIAMALWHAGRALEALELTTLAIEAVESVLRRPPAARHIPSPTLCHGVGGLLMVCLRLAPAAPGSQIEAAIPVLTEQILDGYNAAAPLGYRDEEQPGVFVDDPGFLTGAAGVVLALLAAAGDVPPDWDRVLLLS
ncbi:lanthionine synthetase C family protein [Solwaraspora sp. WMMD1047]|uniref:lanthionine synthetase C family protein n=1 Tax=Solwaraspora sp. WMMD1047 TaxID=3016102 RepID=UPI002417CBA1|nr:lanthionine synthetase C family protein [Solwaraspora sp. WMMD1047]MDG4830610.1 lanthionine synthetase C family protein [Solwaraspora sp. WMMD1047]